MANFSGLPPVDVTPPAHRNLDPNSPLDTSLFRKDISIIAAKIRADQTSDFLKARELHGILLGIPRIRNISSHHHSFGNKENLLLTRAKTQGEIPASALAYLEAKSLGFQPYTLTLGYEYWSADEIMSAILPEDLSQGTPTGYTHTGHIAHLNLRDEYLPFKRWIGQLILEKSPSVTTVVNKLDSIDHQFRFFKMELLAGEPEYLVEAHESGCRFKFDFSSVYWNSRLHAEHDRLVALFKPGEVIADVFAGVGPFAVPAAKKGCGIWANDLNPHSYEFLNVNVELNSVQGHVKTSMLDGAAFIKQVPEKCWNKPFVSLSPVASNRAKRAAVRKQIEERRQDPCTRSISKSLPRVQGKTDINCNHRRISHFVMNLPDAAVSFLGSFKGAFNAISSDPNFSQVYQQLPLVHCYGFTRESERGLAEADLRARVEHNLGASVDLDFHFVRPVAPNKDMYCVTFRLPASIAIQK